MNSNKHYKFVVRKATVTKRQDIEELATIALLDIRNGFCLPHPITDFIKSVYADGNNYNTQKAPAEEIKRFLNWLLIENYEIYQLYNLEELGFHHGVDYLNHLKNVRKLQRATVKTANRYLTAFYDFLHKRKILPEHMNLKSIDDRSGKRILISPFLEHGATLPPKRLKEDKIVEFPDQRLITYFLEVAEQVAPDIAFGIYLQMFGGLRKGEVVNLTLSSLRPQGPFARQGLTVVIQYRPELFIHLKDTSKMQVKNERVQPIQIVDYLPRLYEKATLRLQEFHETNPHYALFVDNDGKPMSGAVYENRFSKVKKHFFKELAKINSPHLAYLKSVSWETHIGRGIYTNLMAPIVSSAHELAVLRGDKSLESALSYMSKLRIKKEVQQGLEDMFGKGEM